MPALLEDPFQILKLSPKKPCSVRTVRRWTRDTSPSLACRRRRAPPVCGAPRLGGVARRTPSAAERPAGAAGSWPATRSNCGPTSTYPADFRTRRAPTRFRVERHEQRAWQVAASAACGSPTSAAPTAAARLARACYSPSDAQGPSKPGRRPRAPSNFGPARASGRPLHADALWRLVRCRFGRHVADGAARGPPCKDAGGGDAPW